MNLNIPGVALWQTQELATMPSCDTLREAYDARLFHWTIFVQIYQALVRDGQLPDVGLVWGLGRIACSLQSNPYVREYIETLDATNYAEARRWAVWASDTPQKWKQFDYVIKVFDACSRLVDLNDYRACRAAAEAAENLVALAELVSPGRGELLQAEIMKDVFATFANYTLMAHTRCQLTAADINVPGMPSVFVDKWVGVLDMRRVFTEYAYRTGECGVIVRAYYALVTAGRLPYRDVISPYVHEAMDVLPASYKRPKNPLLWADALREQAGTVPASAFVSEAHRDAYAALYIADALDAVADERAGVVGAAAAAAAYLGRAYDLRYSSKGVTDRIVNDIINIIEAEWINK